MSEQKKSFQKLSPTNSADISAYKDALDFAFQHEDVRNIGLTGAYGAGKTSIIKSYEKASKGKKKFLFISLAHFSDDEEIRNGKTLNKSNSNMRQKSPRKISEETKEKESSDDINDIAILEGKIINQLVHQIDEENIPKTNFLIKRSSTSDFAIKLTVGVVIFILASLYLLFFKKWIGVVNSLDSEVFQSILDFTTRKSLLILDLALLTGLGSFALYKFFLLQKDRRIIKKLSLNGNDIEVFSNCEESYFDKYLNDVIYLFENASVDAIIFEDIDRYKCVKIFERLREINELVNRRLNDEATIRFIYLLQDDIFTFTERTKFFDFIIPIIPVVDNSNAYNILREHFESNGVFSQFNDGYLSNVALYIEDMRLLKNICNEFDIYLSCISSIKPDFNKLLSLIIYKNLFPKDFILFQMNKGFINSLFDRLDTVKKEKVEQLRNKISENRETIKQIKNELALSLAELDVVYTQLYRNKNTNTLTAEQQETLNQRKELVKKRIANEDEVLQQENEALEEEIQRVSYMRYSNFSSLYEEMVFKEATDSSSSYTDIEGGSYYGLLKYLLRNGYIDNNYHDYITYFYPNSMSYNDKMFVMSIRDSKTRSYFDEITNPKNVVDHLKLNDFFYPSIINVNILKYLLSSSEENSNKLDAFIALVIKENDSNFINAYFDTRPVEYSLIRRIASQWPEYINVVLNSDAISLRLKSTIVYGFILAVDVNQLALLDINKILSTYLRTSLFDLQVQENDIPVLINALKILDVNVDFDESVQNSMELFKQVYSNSLYRLSIKNIIKILEKIYNIQNVDIGSIISQIYSKPKEVLVSYINESLPELIMEIIELSNGQINDNEIASLTILNDTRLIHEVKISYLSVLNTKISVLTDIDDVSLWSALLDYGICITSSENIVAYFMLSGNGLDEYLIKLINSSSIRFTMSNTEINKKYPRRASEFFFAVVGCNQINDNQYDEILTALNYYYSEFNIEGLSESKIETLIKRNLLKMDVQTLANIRSNYPASLSKFIGANLDDYKVIIQKEGIIISEIVEILLMSDVNYRKRISFLELTSESIPIRNRYFSASIEAYIIRHNLDLDELPHLLIKYSSLKLQPQKALESMILSNLSQIISQAYALDGALLRKVLANIEIKKEAKFHLLANSITKLLFTDFIPCLKIIDDQNLICIFSNSHPAYPNTEVNMKLIKNLHAKKWINSYTITPKGTIRVNGCKAKYRIVS